MMRALTIGLGGACGKGLVYERGTLIGKTALDDVTRGNFEFQAGASAVALKAGASKDLGYTKGVAVVTATTGGLMYEAAIGGQKFTFEKIENQANTRRLQRRNLDIASG